MKLLSSLNKSLIASVLLMSAGLASATDYVISNPLETYGNPGYVSDAVTFSGPTSFEDKWSFNVGSAGSFFSALGIANASPVSYIENVLLNLYAVGNPVALFGGGENILDAPLTAGNYYVIATGDVTGTRGGSYHFYASLTPVPEPSELVMMLAGLSLIGFRLSKNRKV